MYCIIQPDPLGAGSLFPFNGPYCKPSHYNSPETNNVINVKSCDAAIAVGGEFGTLPEIALALKCGCPLVLLDSWSFTPHCDHNMAPGPRPAGSRPAMRPRRYDWPLMP